MIVDPVQSAIAAYKGVDDIFRQDRLDEERKQQQAFQNNLALTQDKRAQESHQLQMDKVDRQQKLQAVQSLRYRLASKAPLTDEDLEILEQDPIVSKYLKNPKLIDEALQATAELHVKIPALLQDKPAPTQTTEEFMQARMKAKQDLLKNVNMLPTVPERLGRSGKKGEIGEFFTTENGLVVEKQYQENGKTVKVPLTENASTDPNDKIKFYGIKDVMTKITNNAKMLDGLKAALEARSVELGDTRLLEDAEKKAKTLDQVTALASSESFKKALKGTYGELLQSGLEMAQQGLMEGAEFAKLAQLATTKEIETKVKNQQDETEAATAVLGYAGMGKDAPRTAAMANQLAGLMKEQKISGKRASKMLELMFNAEQKAADRQATIRAAAARAGGGGGGDKLPAEAKMIEYYTKVLKLPLDEALNRVSGAKENPGKLILDTFMKLKEGQIPGHADNVPDDVLMKQAEGYVNKYLLKTTLPSTAQQPQQLTATDAAYLNAGRHAAAGGIGKPQPAAGAMQAVVDRTGKNVMIGGRSYPIQQGGIVVLPNGQRMGVQ